MAVTKLKTGHGVHERRDGAGGLVALAELADMLREFNAEAREAADAAVDIAPFLEGLKAVERHIRALKPLDADGRECAARHYFAGVFAGACGDDSVIARGVSGSLAQQARGFSGMAARCFARVARIGQRHGRVFATWRAQREPA